LTQDESLLRTAQKKANEVTHMKKGQRVNKVTHLVFSKTISHLPLSATKTKTLNKVRLQRAAL